MIYDVAVVGAGACGLTAAIHLNPKKIILFDSKKGAKKLSITGNNICNVTNKLGLENFIEHYKPNGNFLRDAFKLFFVNDTIKFLQSLGIQTTLDNTRVILKNKTSKEMSSIILQIAKDKTTFRPNERIIDIRKEGDLFILKTQNHIYISKIVLLACGGKSFKHTGTDGTCYDIAKKLGHTIVKPTPFEVPFCSKNTENLQGISLYNKEITLKINNKKKTITGDIIFTHFGISGPAILELSENDFEQAILKINLIGDKEAFENNLMSYKGKVKNLIKRHIPQRLADNIMRTDKYVKELSKKEINSIIDTLINFSFTVKKCSFDKAFVTKGGISTKEIDPKTMESKIVKNLFFCGELIDIQGSIGGFNLQAAFSTGFLAAYEINKKFRKNRKAFADK